MANIATAKVSVDLQIGENHYLISEGDHVKNLVFTSNGVQKEVEEGAVVIIGTSIRVSSVPNVTTSGGFIDCVCNPDSTFDEYVKVNALLVDHSTKYDSNVDTVQVQDIVSIGEVVHQN